MPVFSYSALTLTGQAEQGLEAADSLEQLSEILSARDLILKRARISRAAASPGRPPLKHIANFNRELTVLLRAGISIPESLALLSVRPGQPKLEKALQTSFGAWKREDHPELRKGAEQFVRTLRKSRRMDRTG